MIKEGKKYHQTEKDRKHESKGEDKEVKKEHTKERKKEKKEVHADYHKEFAEEMRKHQLKGVKMVLKHHERMAGKIETRGRKKKEA